MIYNLDNTARIGKPVRVYDANGLEWYNCIECDTEAGRIVMHKYDKDGYLLINRDPFTVVTEQIVTAAPLLVVPITMDEATKLSQERRPVGYRDLAGDEVRLIDLNETAQPKEKEKDSL